jgi:hypothetical protein
VVSFFAANISLNESNVSIPTREKVLAVIIAVAVTEGTDVTVFIATHLFR